MSEDSWGDVGFSWGVGCGFYFTGHLPRLYYFIPFILCSFVITAIRKPYTYSSNFLSLYLRSLPWCAFPYLLGYGHARKPQIRNEQREGQPTLVLDSWIPVLLWLWVTFSEKLTCSQPCVKQRWHTLIVSNHLNIFWKLN